MKRKTLRERAWYYWDSYLWGADNRTNLIQAWLAGYRAGKREGKAEAMKATGWGKP